MAYMNKIYRFIENTSKITFLKKIKTFKTFNFEIKF